MHKSVVHSDFASDSVLSNDPWSFVELWLQRGKHWNALPFWSQARRFADASAAGGIEAAPLALYYSFMNATKALLVVRGASHSDQHGVSGDRPETAKASLENEIVKFQTGGILPALCNYFKDTANKQEYSLKMLLWNMPFVHRAFLHTYRSAPELFVPLEDCCYVHKEGSNESWFQARVSSRYADGRRLRNLPKSFEWFAIDSGDKGTTYIRRKKRFRWFVGRGSQAITDAALKRLVAYHQTTRRMVMPISGNRDLWYIRRSHDSNALSGRHGLSIMFAAMHRLSELARYDPSGLERHLSGQANWLLTEFIEHAPSQFIDQISSEITGYQFWRPGIRS